ncbi:DUF3168 domain-containing protein [Thioclava sp. GXIMD4215]|uniref:DUF3168 domain-containing protein n=1 Tax=Thioclava sp. GXIMD4215 TaxID=3131928 RepID=UPI003244A965
MSADLEFQKAIRARMIASADVLALVPAASIIDRNQRPNPVPSIILGETQEVDEGGINRSRTRIYHTLHIWQKEPSLAGAKAIAQAVRMAFRGPRLSMPAPYTCGDLLLASVRFLRDPDGEHSHGVMVIEGLISEDLA